ncbi:alpha-ketoglutarate-dependent dioxygenase AlkB family protein [Haloflavibacter putidus]|nr:alpha-ketoglutarate-dependent dioxygenase AlkB [Haloflavibacter putidus]
MRKFDLPNSKLIYYERFLDAPRANSLFGKLLAEIKWQQDKITLFGKTHLQPRLTALFSVKEKTYTYSGITMHPQAFPDYLYSILLELNKKFDTNFNTCLVNLYRDGADSNGWHADNEKELGKNPVIASISLGEIRKFKIKHNTLKKEKLDFWLESGSLLLMAGETQHYWKHQIPKTKKPVKPRINLTFREIK